MQPILFLSAFVSLTCGQIQLERDEKELVKKVRRLRPDGSESDSCPMFDGVQVHDFHASFVVNAANVETE